MARHLYKNGVRIGGGGVRISVNDPITHESDAINPITRIDGGEYDVISNTLTVVGPDDLSLEVIIVPVLSESFTILPNQTIRIEIDPNLTDDGNLIVLDPPELWVNVSDQNILVTFDTNLRPTFPDGQNIREYDGTLVNPIDNINSLVNGIWNRINVTEEQSLLISRMFILDGQVGGNGDIADRVYFAKDLAGNGRVNVRVSGEYQQQFLASTTSTPAAGTITDSVGVYTRHPVSGCLRLTDVIPGTQANLDLLNNALQPGGVAVNSVHVGAFVAPLSAPFVVGPFNLDTDHIQVNDITIGDVTHSFADDVVPTQKMRIALLDGTFADFTILRLNTSFSGSTLVSFTGELPNNIMSGEAILVNSTVIEEIAETGAGITVAAEDGIATITNTWGTAPTGTKPDGIAWQDVITPITHDDVTGEVLGGSVLGADFSHPAATNALSLLFTFQTEDERDIVLDQYFIPQIKAIGPAPLDVTTARVIDRVVSTGTTQINVFFESGITVSASDFADASIFLYNVDVERIHKIEGGSYENGVVTIPEAGMAITHEGVVTNPITNISGGTYNEATDTLTVGTGDGDSTVFANTSEIHVDVNEGITTLDLQTTLDSNDEIIAIGGIGVHSGDINFRDFDTFNGLTLNQYEVIRLPEFNRAFVRLTSSGLPIGTPGQTEAFLLNLFTNGQSADFQEIALGQNIPGTTFISTQAEANAIGLSAADGQLITIEGGSYQVSVFHQLQYGPTQGQMPLGGDFLDSDVYLTGYEASGANIGTNPVFDGSQSSRYNIQINFPDNTDGGPNTSVGRYDLLANGVAVNLNAINVRIAVRQNVTDQWIIAGQTEDSSQNGHEGRIRIARDSSSEAAFGTEADPNILVGACLGLLENVTLADGLSYVWNQTQGRFDPVTPSTRTVTSLPGGEGGQSSTPSYEDNVLVQNGDIVFLQGDATATFGKTIVPTGLWRYRLVSQAIQGWVALGKSDQYNNNIIYGPGETIFNEVDDAETPFRAIIYTNDWNAIGIFQPTIVVGFTGLDGNTDIAYYRWSGGEASTATDIPGVATDWVLTFRPFHFGVEPGVASNWESYWTRLNPYVGEQLEEIEDGIRVQQIGVDGITREQIDLFNNPATGNNVTPTHWRLTLNEGETNVANIATLQELIDSSKWGIAPTGVKPNDVSWKELTHTLVHDDVIGEISGGGELGADFMHPAATNSLTLLITLASEDERDIAREQFFLPGTRAIGPTSGSFGDARVIDRVQNQGNNALLLTFETGITVPVSDSNDSTLTVYTVESEFISKIEGGSYANGVLTISGGEVELYPLQVGGVFGFSDTMRQYEGVTGSLQTASLEYSFDPIAATTELIGNLGTFTGLTTGNYIVLDHAQGRTIVRIVSVNLTGSIATIAVADTQGEALVLTMPFQTQIATIVRWSVITPVFLISTQVNNLPALLTGGFLLIEGAVNNRDEFIDTNGEFGTINKSYFFDNTTDGWYEADAGGDALISFV